MAKSLVRCSRQRLSDCPVPFAICTWGITGIGLTRGYATSIPVVERDFIFAAICEEFGSIFAIGLLAIFILILLEELEVL